MILTTAVVDFWLLGVVLVVTVVGAGVGVWAWTAKGPKMRAKVRNRGLSFIEVASDNAGILAKLSEDPVNGTSCMNRILQRFSNCLS